MGMCLMLLRVEETELESYLEDSSLLDEAINSELFEERDVVTDLQKEWDGLIFLFTGESFGTMEESNFANPVVRAMLSGQLINENQHITLSPANYLTVKETHEVYQQLIAINIEDFLENLNLDEAQKKQVYIYGRNSGDLETEKQWLKTSFKDLVEHYRLASEAHQAVISFIC